MLRFEMTSQRKSELGVVVLPKICFGARKSKLALAKYFHVGHSQYLKRAQCAANGNTDLHSHYSISLPLTS